MNLRTRAAVAVAAALTTATGVAAPALAAQMSSKDPADATASLNDLRRLTVDHGTERVRGTVAVTDLRRSTDGGPASIQIFLDTDAARRGPEFRLASGLQEGTDYQLTRMRHWKPVSGPLGCAHHLTLDFADDVVRFRVGRACLDTPDRVRVAVKMVDEYDGSHPVVDWFGGRRHLTRWLGSD
jgi:hypothetical protein